jgi:hypothetical protein
MSNYSQEIIEILNSEKPDWDLVARLANAAKMSESQELIFNLRSGYLNYIEGNYDLTLANFFIESGAIVIQCSNQPELNKILKMGTLTIDIVKDNIVILFAGKSTILERLTRLEYPINYYRCKIRTKRTEPNPGNVKWSKHCVLNHISTNTSHKFEINEQLFKGLSRDLQMKAIFDDKEL